MPRYHALDTAIRLCAWDPYQEQTKSDNHAIAPGVNAFTFSNYTELSHPRKRETYGPATGYIIHDLKEEYFGGRDGVGFLDPGMPFYLVKVGKELFKAKDAIERPIPGSEVKSLLGTPPRVSEGNKENLDLSPHSSVGDSSLSSIDSAVFADEKSPEKRLRASAMLSTPRDAVVVLIAGVADEKAKSAAGLKPFDQKSESVPTSNVLKPITIKIELSPRSFMPSINTNIRQELLVTIFYNGELTHSKILRANTFHSLRGPVDDQKYQYYSGRRIDTWSEVPWVVDTGRSNVEGSMKFVDRWNKINQTLLAEADQWGHYGMFRSPMGEYLEELSKLPAPGLEELERLEGSGIIDVVITLGRNASTAISGLREPRRKLHEDRCGKNRTLIIVPEELRPSKKAKIVAQFDMEISRSPAPNPLAGLLPPKLGTDLMGNQFRNQKSPFEQPHSATGSEAATEDTAQVSGLRPTQTLEASKQAANSMCNDFDKDGSSEVSPSERKAKASTNQSIKVIEFETLTTPHTKPRRASLPTMYSSPLAYQQPIQSKYPPQKRFKGSFSDDDRPKKRKLEKDHTNPGLDSDLGALTFSARLRRAASSPASPHSCPDTYPRQLIRGGRRLPLARETNLDMDMLDGELDDQIHRQADGKWLSRGTFGLDGTADEPMHFAGRRSSTTGSHSRSLLATSEHEIFTAISESSVDQALLSHRTPVNTADVENSLLDESTIHEGSLSTQKSAHRVSSPLHQMSNEFFGMFMNDGSSDVPSGEDQMDVNDPLISRPNTKNDAAVDNIVPPKAMAKACRRPAQKQPKQRPLKPEQEVSGVGSRTTPKTPSKPKTIPDSKVNDSAGVQAASKTHSRVKTKPIASLEISRAEAASSQTTGQPQSRGTPDSVSSRELKGLLTPREGALKADTSFGSSFNQTAEESVQKRSQSNRRAKSVPSAPEITKPLSKLASEVASSRSTSVSSKGGISTNRKTSSFRKPSTNLRAAADTKTLRELQSDEATAKVLQDAIGGKGRAKVVTQSQTEDNGKLTIGQAHALPAISQASAPASLPHVTPAPRLYRRYSVDSEGKKKPAPKSSPPASSPLNQVEEIAEPPKTPSERRRLSSRRSTESLSNFQSKGEISGAVAKLKTSVQPKVSISESLVLTTPTPALVPPIITSQVKTKRKADEISSEPFEKKDVSLRLWKPTSMCDDSILTYLASGEAFPGTNFDPASKQFRRVVKAEREGVFRASGVLMGVRFVVGL